MLHIYSGKGNLLFFLQLRTTIWDSSHHIRFHPEMLSKNILVRSQVDHLVLMSWWGAAFTYRGLLGNQGSGESQHASFSRKVQSHVFGWFWSYQLTQVVTHDKRNQKLSAGVFAIVWKKDPALGFSKDSKYADICGSTTEFNSFAVRFNSKDIYSLLALQHLLSKHHGQKRSSYVANFQNLIFFICVGISVLKLTSPYKKMFWLNCFDQ